METLNLHHACVSSRDISDNNAVRFKKIVFSKREEEEEGKKKS